MATGVQQQTHLPQQQVHHTPAPVETSMISDFTPPLNLEMTTGPAANAMLVPTNDNPDLPQTSEMDLSYQVHFQGSGSLSGSMVGQLPQANTMFAERHTRSFLSDETL